MASPVVQFSQEYIEYILSDEAKALRSKMGWAQRGDWVLTDAGPRLVTETDHHTATYKAGHVWHGQEDWPKLPTLWQLTQIIEDRWPRTGHHSYCLRDGNRYYFFTGTPEHGYAVNSPTEKDKMVAAAKLAVKALQTEAAT